MANTMKFGNGQWATQKDSILAFNDENANFKPLPFTASRASTATVVNKAGLLETVASGIPRVDYLGNTKGAYLLEPSSTNLITQSEAFGNSYWTKSGASIKGDASTAGVEKVTNGDFATNLSGWTNTAGVTWNSGNAKFNGSSGDFYQGGYELGKIYLVTLDYTRISGQLNVNIGSAINPISTGSGGSLSIQINSFGSTNFNLQCISFVGTVDNVSVKEVQGFASPSASSPLGAFKLVEGTSTGAHFINTPSEVSINGSATSSIFAKKGERSAIKLSTNGVILSSAYANFDLLNGVVSASANCTATIKLVGDYYKCTFSYSSNGATAPQVYLVLLTDATDTTFQSYTGDGTSGVYLFGAQLEQKSYASSYIPTAGSAITRVADNASQTVPDGVINSSEGVLYADISAFANDATYKSISISDGSSANQLWAFYYSNNIRFIFTVGGVSQADISYSGSNVTLFNKIAIKWGLNDFKLYVNGIKRGQDGSGVVPLQGVFNRLNFKYASGADYFYGKVKDLRVYNTALTDAELAKLTKI